MSLHFLNKYILQHEMKNTHFYNTKIRIIAEGHFNDCFEPCFFRIIFQDVLYIFVNYLIKRKKMMQLETVIGNGGVSLPSLFFVTPNQSCQEFSWIFCLLLWRQHTDKWLLSIRRREGFYCKLNMIVWLFPLKIYIELKNEPLSQMIALENGEF